MRHRLLPTAIASLPLVYFVAFFAMLVGNPMAFDYIVPIHAVMSIATLLIIGVTFIHALRKLPAGEKTGWLLGLGFIGMIVAPAYWWTQPWTGWMSSMPADRCPTCNRPMPVGF